MFVSFSTLVSLALIFLYFAERDVRGVIGFALLIMNIFLWREYYRKYLRRIGKETEVASSSDGNKETKPLAEILRTPKPLPTLESLVPAPSEKLVEICRAVFADCDWILLRHGTCLFKNNADKDSDKRSITEIYADWTKYGAGMDDGCTHQLKNNSGWLVTCGGFRAAYSVILKGEIEPESDPVRVTVLGFIKRAADFKEPVIIDRS